MEGEELRFGQDEKSIGHPSGYGSLNFGTEVWARDINVFIIRVETVFKAMRLDEITKGTGVDREKD